MNNKAIPVRFKPEDFEKIKEEAGSVIEVLKEHHRSYLVVVLTEMKDEEGNHFHSIDMDCEIFEPPSHEDHIALDLLTSASEAIWRETHKDHPDHPDYTDKD